MNIVSPGFFQTFGTSMLGGRDFTSRDSKAAPHVVIVNEAFARKFTNGQNPIGHHLRQPEYPERPAFDQEIVGYVKDAVYRSLREPVPATMYVPIAQNPQPPSGISISVKAAAGSPSRLTKSLAAALTSVNPNITLTFRPLAEQVNNSLIQERVVAMMSGFFGGLALLLAGLGLYGVTSYSVNRRRTELGIRMALGAAPGGVILGSVVSLWVARFVTTLLYGLQPRDPLTLAGAAAMLGAIGALAGWLPAWRASRHAPMSHGYPARPCVCRRKPRPCSV